ncbi:MAG: AMIN domain-containing protein [Deltaproteobacteria bacterium]|nr:AMIN domain-containing protein [Deltaproteobacteria bacterium]
MASVARDGPREVWVVFPMQARAKFTPRARMMFGLSAALLLLGAADSEPLSKLGKVAIESSESEVVVRLTGSKTPDFTSFTMKDPFRVVVDWAGSTLSGVPADKEVGQGLVRRISSKQFESESEHLSRVTIELARETEFRFATEGKQVLVRFKNVALPPPEPPPAKEEPKAELARVDPIPEGPLTEPAEPPRPPPPPPPVVKKEEPPKVVAAAAAAAPVPVPPATAAAAKSEPAKVVAVAKNDPAKTDPAKTEATKAGAVAKTEPPKAGAVAKSEPPKSAPAALAKADVPAKAEPAVKAPPPHEVAQVAKGEAPAKQVELAKVDPAKAQPAKAEPTKAPAAKTEPTKTEPAKTEPTKTGPTLAAASAPPPPAPAKGSRGADTPNKVTIDVAPKDAPKLAEQRLPDVKLPSAKPEAAPSTPPIASAKPVRLAGWKPASEGPAPIAAQPKPRDREGAQIVLAQASGTVQGRETLPAPKKSGGGDSDFDPGARVMTYLGFRNKSDASEVFVRCDGKARFRVEQAGDNRFVLELIDTHVNVKNNERPLDTSYFKSAVTRVQAVPTGGSTRIEVDLRERVPYEVKRIGSTISIEFKLPSSA